MPEPATETHRSMQYSQEGCGLQVKSSERYALNAGCIHKIAVKESAMEVPLTF
jgi:hypothetical protein